MLAAVWLSAPRCGSSAALPAVCAVLRWAAGWFVSSCSRGSLSGEEVMLGTRWENKAGLLSRVYHPERCFVPGVSRAMPICTGRQVQHCLCGTLVSFTRAGCMCSTQEPCWDVAGCLPARLLGKRNGFAALKVSIGCTSPYKSQIRDKRLQAANEVGLCGSRMGRKNLFFSSGVKFLVGKVKQRNEALLVSSTAQTGL